MSSLAGGGVKKGGRSETTSTYIFMMKQQKKKWEEVTITCIQNQGMAIANCLLMGLHAPCITKYCDPKFKKYHVWEQLLRQQNKP